MIDTLRGLGMRLLGLGISNPFLTVGAAYTYRSLDEAKAAVGSFSMGVAVFVDSNARRLK